MGMFLWDVQKMYVFHLHPKLKLWNFLFNGKWSLSLKPVEFIQSLEPFVFHLHQWL